VKPSGLRELFAYFLTIVCITGPSHFITLEGVFRSGYSRRRDLRPIVENTPGIEGFTDVRAKNSLAGAKLHQSLERLKMRGS
jgi:hypothetical protein